MRWASQLLLAALLLLHAPRLHAQAEDDPLARHFSITAALAGPLRLAAPAVGAHQWHGSVAIDASAIYRFCRWIGAGVRLYDVLGATGSAAATPLLAQGGLGFGLMAESAVYRLPDWLDVSVEAGVDFDFRQVSFASRLPGHPLIGGRHSSVGAHGGVHVEYTFAPMLAVGVGLRYQWFPSASARDAGGHYEDSLSALWPTASITIPAR